MQIAYTTGFSDVVESSMKLSDFVNHKRIEAKIAGLSQAETAYADTLELVLTLENKLKNSSYKLDSFDAGVMIRQVVANPNLDPMLWGLPQEIRETVPPKEHRSTPSLT